VSCQDPPRTTCGVRLGGLVPRFGHGVGEFFVMNQDRTGPASISVMLPMIHKAPTDLAFSSPTFWIILESVRVPFSIYFVVGRVPSVIAQVFRIVAKKYAVVVPARQAYSYSASVGSR